MTWELVLWVLIGMVVWSLVAMACSVLLGEFAPDDPVVNGYACIAWPITIPAIIILLLSWLILERIPFMPALAEYLGRIGTRGHRDRLLRRAKLKP